SHVPAAAPPVLWIGAVVPAGVHQNLYSRSFHLPAHGKTGAAAMKLRRHDDDAVPATRGREQSQRVRLLCRVVVYLRRDEDRTLRHARSDENLLREVRFRRIADTAVRKGVDRAFLYVPR